MGCPECGAPWSAPESKAAQLRGAIRFLGPEEMTPQAVRVLESLANQWDPAGVR